jgi:predicted NBD/HSP70 family sugar kinase
MSLNLGRGLRMIATALAPKEIVIVGDFTSAWYRFGPTIEAEMRRHALSSAAVLRPAYDGGSARLRSAVALVLNSGTLE